MKNIDVKINNQGEDLGRESGASEWKQNRGEDGASCQPKREEKKEEKKVFSKEELKELVKKVFLQLQKGCSQDGCQNKRACLSANPEFKEQKAQDLILKATQLVQELQSAALCQK